MKTAIKLYKVGITLLMVATLLSLYYNNLFTTMDTAQYTLLLLLVISYLMAMKHIK